MKKTRGVLKRVRCHFSGIVQGVGFRPFIYRLATRYSLSGHVQNRSDGVIVEVEGTEEAIASFMSGVRGELPPLAEVSHISCIEQEIKDDAGFRIIESEAGGLGKVFITPDVATCSQCLTELFDPRDRRFRYPFINCTNCGPRLTIIRDIPYDRINTSMSCFPLCPLCRGEYENPADRRFHAEPNACPACGPLLSLLDQAGNPLPEKDPIRKVVTLLLEGYVVAIKGLGGFHLAVDAARDEALRRLRSRKFREEKPLAIMVKDITAAARIALLGKDEEALLLSPKRPIVLLRRRETDAISSVVAPGVADLGIMLPYTPLHHLLLENHFQALVMTSANQVDEPICITNREAIRRLRGIADYFLVHNRDILVRCDDSIVTVASGKTRMLRRSRGFAPKPITLKKRYPDILALGPQMKTTLCILKGTLAYISPHIGDMETPEARDFHQESLALMQRIAECKPAIIACDLHPAYYTTKLAEMLSASRIIKVQHHHAHIVSAMAEHGIEGKVIGMAMDGTGYGADGTVWGGEFLVAEEASFMRIGHLANYLLPGGEKAIREPWRIAVSLLREAYGGDWPSAAEELRIVPEKRFYETMEKIMERNFNSPLTSSLGRLFDGVSALLGIRRTVTFEGQAAMELEAMAKGETDFILPFDIRETGNLFQLDVVPLIRSIAAEIRKGRSRTEIARAFHVTLSAAFRSMGESIRKHTGLNRVVLSGGCFQNRILTEATIAELERAGFTVYCHHLLPANDGCISLGQAVCAGAQVMRQGG